MSFSIVGADPVAAATLVARFNPSPVPFAHAWTDEISILCIGNEASRACLHYRPQEVEKYVVELVYFAGPAFREVCSLAVVPPSNTWTRIELALDRDDHISVKIGDEPRQQCPGFFGDGTTITLSAGLNSIPSANAPPWTVYIDDVFAVVDRD